VKNAAAIGRKINSIPAKTRTTLKNSSEIGYEAKWSLMSLVARVQFLR